MDVLTWTKNELIKKYQHLFALEGAKLTFAEEALRALAKKADKRDTGARALRSVLEDIMLEWMYELPEQDHSGMEYVGDADAIEPPRSLKALRCPRKESSSGSAPPACLHTQSDGREAASDPPAGPGHRQSPRREPARARHRLRLGPDPGVTAPAAVVPCPLPAPGAPQPTAPLGEARRGLRHLPVYPARVACPRLHPGCAPRRG